ncbi:sensory neuron membrane protein 2-like [Arctopsyche grandis]|uniref:sensory neuron membrane protein 2-like n=1 Tax=Arctopsyche grandis TaxID=121162 RepID=UPI00406D7BDD
MAGLVTAVFGIVMAFYGFPKIIRSQIDQRIALKNGTEGYEMWKDMPFPLTFKVYLFNVTNPEEIVSGSKPKLQEVGPYVYDEHRFKDNVVREDMDTVSYDLKKVLKFNEEKSAPFKESDFVTILNIALMGMAITANELMPSMMSTVDGILPYLFDSPSDPFVRATVADLLFNGIFINCTSTDMTVALVCQGMKSRLPPTIRASDDDSGFYYSMFNHINDTYDGPYSIHSGVINANMLGNIVSYKNKSTLEEFEGACSDMKGTDTTVFAPINESNYSKIIYIFQPDICRSMYAEFIAKKMTFGLQTFRYETTKMVLASGDTNPKNKCFCTKNWSSVHDGCSLNGVQNLEPCQNAPVIVSFPHFYLADQILRDYVAEGLNPKKEEHETFVEIEPKTGAALKGAKRVQFNMELQKIEAIGILSAVEPGLFPILWIEESAEVNEKVKKMLMSVHDKIKYLKVLQWIIVAIGIILMMAACHFKRRGLVEKWSWSPNRVDMDMPSYGASVPGNEIARPAAAQKEGRFQCFQNKGFCNNESVAHQ